MCDEDELIARHEGEISDTSKLRNVKPAVYRLNIDCLNRIFDYLSLRDVHSFGQTCKPMQQLAGEYFQSNYITEAYADGKDRCIVYPDHCSTMDGFDKFVTNLMFMPYFSTYQGSIKKSTFYAGNNYNQWLKQIRFHEAFLTGAECINLRKIWEHLESVYIENCNINRKFFDRFPTLCTNLKKLYVKDLNCGRNVMRRNLNEWLLVHYPHLVHLHWTQSNHLHRINELKTFFQLNSGLRSFTTDAECLWTNRYLIMESQIKLDDLTIEFGNNGKQSAEEHSQNVYSLLVELHALSIYKRLHFNLKHFDQHMINQMPSLSTLKSVALDQQFDDNTDHVKIPHWMNLSELKVSLYCRLFDTSSVSTQMTKLERVYLHCTNLNDMLTFLRQSRRLKKMKVKYIDRSDDFNNIISLDEIDGAREKLEGATKVALYLNEKIYLATKWAMNGRDFSFVEIRRQTSDDWGWYFFPYT